MAIAELHGTEAYPVPSQAQVAVIHEIGRAHV
jgi:hypothetical protein